MDEDIRELVEGAEKAYKPFVVGANSRIEQGKELWEQFESATSACARLGAIAERQLHEKINELATAKVLAEDPNITNPISYEPNFLPSGRKIDFVVPRDEDNLYVEVKTVHPSTPDNEQSWAR